nr:CHAT domain-containing tetratricopeptide repeat protein [Coleofasciculus sp. FACHB-125]
MITAATPFAPNFPALFLSTQALAQTPDARKAEADQLFQQGIQQAQASQFEAALQSWQQALSLYREIKDRQYEGASLGNLGLAYDSLGDYAKAIDYHQQSLAIAREIKDRQSEGVSLNNLGIPYYSLGDYAKAIDYYQQSLAIAREIQDRLGEGNALSSLGSAYYSIGDYAKAIDYQQQRLAIAQEIKDRQGEGQSLGNLGTAYTSLGDYAKAIEYHQQGLAIAQEIKDRLGEGISLGNLGLAYHNLGDYAKAIDYQQQRLAIAREIKDRLGEGHSLSNLGLTYYFLGNYTKVIEYQQQSLAIAKEIKDRFGEGVSLNTLGLAFQKLGNLAQAEETLRAGIEVWESLREQLGDLDAEKVSIFEQQARTYRRLQQVLIAQNQPTKALEVAERGRARAFVERLATRFSSTGPNVSTNPPNIQQIQQIAQQQNATLVEYSIIYDEFKIQGKQEARESELYIWVIPPSGVVSFRRVDLKPLWQQQNTTLPQLVLNSRESIGVRGRGGIEVSLIDEVSQTKRLQQLHQLLIQPIADLLPTDPKARVIFIPQQSLFLVPFAALQDTNNKYLIEQHTLRTAPSIQVLALTRQQRQRVPVSAKDVLVVGNPTMPSLAPKIGEKPQPLSPLPGAQKEAMEIARLLNTTALTGNQATESAVVQKLPTAKMIHLATHGLLDDFQGLGIPGAIALTPSGKDDGFLTASEILNLKLNAELVVLSACDTGRGKLTGDGVIGLSRSLITAGVPSVIVTLWAIPDNPSALLMTEFYRNLQQNPDKAQALRGAMLTTMKQYPNQPSAWAAYTLIGEAE